MIDDLLFNCHSREDGNPFPRNIRKGIFTVWIPACAGMTLAVFFGKFFYN